MLKQIGLALTGAIATGVGLGSSAEAAVFWPGNGNYYDFIPGKITWENAKIAAENLSFQGVSGHLVTITSREEDNFLLHSFGLIPAVWIGASDAEEEGIWRWVTGPETGTTFWFGDSSGTSANGTYSNWNDGEPNNSLDYGPNGEDYAIWNHQPSLGQVDFAWNDTTNDPEDLLEPANRISGYLVEFETSQASAVPEPVSVLAVLTFGAVIAGGTLKKTTTG